MESEIQILNKYEKNYFTFTRFGLLEYSISLIIEVIRLVLH